MTEKILQPTVNNYLGSSKLYAVNMMGSLSNLLSQYPRSLHDAALFFNAVCLAYTLCILRKYVHYEGLHTLLQHKFNSTPVCKLTFFFSAPALFKPILQRLLKTILQQHANRFHSATSCKLKPNRQYYNDSAIIKHKACYTFKS